MTSTLDLIIGLTIQVLLILVATFVSKQIQHGQDNSIE